MLIRFFVGLIVIVSLAGPANTEASQGTRSLSNRDTFRRSLYTAAKDFLSWRFSMIRFLTFLLLAVFAVPAQTQTVESKQSENTKPSSTKTAKDPDAERAARERRSQARSLLIALAVDARTFRDQPLRARALARIADALWTVDPEQARSMFRKAWEAAEFADEESERKLQEEVAQQKKRTGGGYAIDLPPNLRREVLRLVARHDRVLGEELLEKLKAQSQESSQNVSHSSDANSQRMAVATELLAAGEAEKALAFAEPTLTTINRQTIDFLSYVREKNPAAADARYANLLASSAVNPQADANTVSLLSSYIFTPHLLISFSGNGVSSSQSSDKIVAADVSPALLTAFFNTAAAILLRPSPPPGQDQSTSGLDGKYLVIKRLLPFFEQGAAPEQTQSLRSQLEALNQVVSDNTRRRDDEWIRRGVAPEKSAQDREQAVLDRIDRAKTSDERDRLYIQLAFMTAGRGDIRARDFVSKVEEPELRKQLQLYIDPSLAQTAIQKKQFDLALTLAEKGELTHIHRTWILTEAAKNSAKTDRQKSMDLIDDAAAEARRMDVSDPNLARGLLAVANALTVIDPTRAWDATFDAVKAANSAEGFTGEDGELVMKFQSKGQSSVHNQDVPDFDVAGIFRTLADKDYDRAVELARGFQGEGPRAVATIAIARAVLEPKKSARPGQ